MPEGLIYLFFYSTGFILTPILTFGILKADAQFFKLRHEKWKFGKLVYIENDQKYLACDWVMLLGFLFWAGVLFTVYSIRN